MAIGTSHPPRAYTREILTAAFNWLQSQPDSVRTQATTPDALVGLYTRAHRFGAANLETEAPVSSQNFMSDLKNLAEGLKAFDGTKSTVSTPSSNLSAAPSASAATVSATMGPGFRQSPAATMPPKAQTFFDQMIAPAQVAAPIAAAVTATAPSASMTATPMAAPITAPMTEAPSLAALPGLNERSVQMLQEVQAALNLSSDSEAANMMIALAYKSLKATLLT